MYCPIECTPKPSFVKLLGLTRITYIYWSIKCPPKPTFVKLLGLEIITYIYWLIDYTPKTFICSGVQGWKNNLHLLAN
jgi:hypothetical protein